MKVRENDLFCNGHCNDMSYKIGHRKKVKRTRNGLNNALFVSTLDISSTRSLLASLGLIVIQAAPSLSGEACPFVLEIKDKTIKNVKLRTPIRLATSFKVKGKPCVFVPN